MKIAKKIIQNNEEIKLDASNIAYKDLQGIARLLGWAIIVESGENENGNYIKFGDGTMFCYASGSFIAPTMVQYVANGLWGVTNVATFYFPEKFTKRPFVEVKIIRGEAVEMAPRTVTSSSFNANLLTRADFSEQRIEYDLFAIGKWK